MLAQNIAILVWADVINGYSPSSPYVIGILALEESIWIETCLKPYQEHVFLKIIDYRSFSSSFDSHFILIIDV